MSVELWPMYEKALVGDLCRHDFDLSTAGTSKRKQIRIAVFEIDGKRALCAAARWDGKRYEFNIELSGSVDVDHAAAKLSCETLRAFLLERGHVTT